MDTRITLHVLGLVIQSIVSNLALAVDKGHEGPVFVTCDI